ncbi:MAG TPA: hypothetical protein DCE42_18755 [Myxococcales bacterium]|nr:hypothetical protein [Deltaproteobacteria bacterium]MBK07354.1 hypothetical protein [Deltaproteobacteria bacterium]MBU53521.1 hypothetical protein [Deltaproteobacteria bacterium]HAA56814.1 hypothetical protein [Myxococcales bacterium]|tara:strand:- start:3906 stop:4364 length:459 start_codon:yes stop_codon:yes gene_type:complete
MSEQFPQDAIPNNGWVMELPGLTSPHIEKVSGISKETGELEMVDGGTNRTFYFSDGVLKHGDLTISRTRDGSNDDQVFGDFFEKMVGTGKKYNGTLIQYRFGQVVTKIKFQGLLMRKFSLSDMNINESNKSEQTYECKVDFTKITYNQQARI